MLFLLLAILCNSVESIVVRFSEANLHNRRAVTMINYLAAVLLSAFFVHQPLWIWEAERAFPLGLGIFNGCLFIVWLILFQICVRQNGAALSAIFAKLGVLLPTFGAILFFHESPSVLQICGIVVALTAVVLFNLPEKHLYSEGKTQNFVQSGGLLLILVLVIGGAADFNSKIFESAGNPTYDGLFLFYSFLTCLFLSIVYFLLGQRTINKRDICYGLLIGIPNQLTTMCLLQAVMRLPASVVFPVYSVAVILTVSLIDRLVFHSKFSPRQWLSLVLVCIALALLNL